MTDIDIEWGDPPPITRGRWGIHQRIVDALKARPGQWARVRAGIPKSRANQAVDALKKLGCDATRRSDSTAGTVDVWARWPEGEVAADD